MVRTSTPGSADLKRAIGSLSRVTALESPPNEKGERLIMHRGDGAELVSQVQADGKLLKQQLVLFDDVVLWQHGVPVRTGAKVAQGGAVSGPRFAHAELDGKLDRQRLERLRVAVEGYLGGDHSIEHLALVVLLVHSHALGSAPLVTRAASELSGRSRRGKVKGGVPLAAVLAGLAVLAAIALLLWRL